MGELHSLTHTHTHTYSVTHTHTLCDTHTCTPTNTPHHSIIVVGGDGTFNEVLNGLLVQTQQQSGVNTRRPRFVPVTPYIRLGIIPAGFHNSTALSILGAKCPMITAAQIMLGKLAIWVPTVYN